MVQQAKDRKCYRCLVYEVARLLVMASWRNSVCSSYS